MKKVLLLSTVAVMIAAFANATIRRVGFFGIPVSGVDYTNFTSAYNASVSGDTLLVFPVITGIQQTVAKKLIIIGTGDWLDSTSTPKGNGSMQAFVGTPTVNSINFAAGSDGSEVMGFYGGAYTVQVSNITIRRNRECAVYIASYQSTYSNLQILENYRVGIFNNGTNASVINNMTVSNNLITTFSTAAGNTYSGNITNNVWAYDNTLNAGSANGGTSSMSSSSGIELGNGQYLIQNNIFASNVSTIVGNNYLYFSFSNGGNSVFNYNLALQTATGPNWGVGVGNVVTPLASVSSIFANFPAIGTASADARYKLGASSPAATVGAGSKPIGMYGGTNPYKLSVIPPIPTIYKLSSPQGNNPTGASITINVSTRGNN